MIEIIQKKNSNFAQSALNGLYKRVGEINSTLKKIIAILLLSHENYDHFTEYQELGFCR